MKNKKFDSVKMMRDIRDKISEKTNNLSDKDFIELLKREFPDIQKKLDYTLKRKIS
ncbi:MAG: hypothetical protein V1874_08570 [Spirochaetota bacterium]